MMGFFGDSEGKKKALEACAAEHLEYILCLKEGTNIDSFFACTAKQKTFYRCYEDQRGHFKSKFAASIEGYAPLARLHKSDSESDKSEKTHTPTDEK
mmetsp:Transcript_44309/g.73820  ORF Transcript_44309/g.73820 Transcript_44309/m.73820 type:complete len:97 (+) Transcript_44309:395-685(+)